MNNESQLCPICYETNNKINEKNERNKICFCCSIKAVDQDGNKVRFQNVDVFGGFKSIHTDRKGHITEKKEHICYIFNHKCYADESRFGGIDIHLYK